MTYLFTHNDLDGVGCAVIARLGIPQPLSITYCSYGSVDHEICDLLDKLTTPAEILISDISVKEETARRLDEYTRIYGAVEIKLMGVLVEQPLGIAVFTVYYDEGILNHPLNTLSGV